MVKHLRCAHACLWVTGFLMFGSAAFADHDSARSEDHRLILERVGQLENEIRLLRSLLDRLTVSLGERNLPTAKTGDKWGCYVTDIDGTFYGTGNTEAAAHGKALYECKKRLTVGCFEQDVKCNSE